MLFPEIAFGDYAKPYYSGCAYFCGVEEILLETLALREEFRRIVDDGEAIEPEELFGPVTFDDSLLVLSSSGDPAMICMDLAPPAGGKVGQIVAVKEQPWVAAVLAPSLCEFLNQIINGYRNDRFRSIEMEGVKYFTERKASEAS